MIQLPPAIIAPLAHQPTRLLPSQQLHATTVVAASSSSLPQLSLSQCHPESPFKLSARVLISIVNPFTQHSQLQRISRPFLTQLPSFILIQPLTTSTLQTLSFVSSPALSSLTHLSSSSSPVSLWSSLLSFSLAKHHHQSTTTHETTVSVFQIFHSVNYYILSLLLRAQQQSIPSELPFLHLTHPLLTTLMATLLAPSSHAISQPLLLSSSLPFTVQLCADSSVVVTSSSSTTTPSLTTLASPFNRATLDDVDNSSYSLEPFTGRRTVADDVVFIIDSPNLKSYQNLIILFIGGDDDDVANQKIRVLDNHKKCDKYDRNINENQDVNQCEVFLQQRQQRQENKTNTQTINILVDNKSIEHNKIRINDNSSNNIDVEGDGQTKDNNNDNRYGNDEKKCENNSNSIGVNNVINAPSSSSACNIRFNINNNNNNDDDIEYDHCNDVVCFMEPPTPPMSPPSCSSTPIYPGGATEGGTDDNSTNIIINIGKNSKRNARNSPRNNNNHVKDNIKRRKDQQARKRNGKKGKSKRKKN